MSLETLLIKHAALSDLKRELKSKGIEELNLCTNRKSKEVHGFPGIFIHDGPSCLDSFFEGFNAALNEASEFADEGFFEESWSDSVAEGYVCQHCQNVRRLKRQRVKASSDLGQIRGAITRVGRRLAKEQAA